MFMRYKQFNKERFTMKYDNLNIIAFSGFSNSGKTTAANVIDAHLKENYIDGDIFSPTNYVSNTACTIFGYPFMNVIKMVDEKRHVDNEFFNSEKMFWQKHLKMRTDYRSIMKKVGEGMKELFNDSIWAIITEHRIISKFYGSEYYAIIPEIRYTSEMNMLKRFKNNGANVKHYIIFRDSSLPDWAAYGLSPTNYTHRSIIKKDFKGNKKNGEYEWCSDKNYKFTGYISNDGTIEEFKNNLINLVF